jgi:hypothetical protein
MAITDTFSKTKTRGERKARKKEEDEALSRLSTQPGSISSGAGKSRKKTKKQEEDPQKIINQMKLKERPSYGQATNPLRSAAEKAVSQPTSEQRARAEYYRAHLPEKSK